MGKMDIWRRCSREQGALHEGLWSLGCSSVRPGFKPFVNRSPQMRLNGAQTAGLAHMATCGWTPGCWTLRESRLSGDTNSSGRRGGSVAPRRRVGEARGRGAWRGAALLIRSSGSVKQSRDGELGLRRRGWSMWGAGDVNVSPGERSRQGQSGEVRGGEGAGRRGEWEPADGTLEVSSRGRPGGGWL